MQRGFANLNMKEKNKLKDAMKNMAPEIADLMNAYKDLGLAVPVAQKFRGKGLKQMKDENFEAILKRQDEINRGAVPEKQAPARALREEMNRFKPRPEQPAEPIPAVKKQPPKAGEDMRGNAKMIRQNELDFEKNLPAKIDRKDMRHPDDGGGINGTYKITTEGGGIGFYKPANKERGGARADIHGNYYTREIMGYETAKVFKLDDMVAPTKLYSPEVVREGRVSPKSENIGAVQQSAVEFGKKLGLTNVQSAGYHGNILDKCENAQDMLVLDFIMANTDRHSGN
jgi:hypothetical protein